MNYLKSFIQQTKSAIFYIYSKIESPKRFLVLSGANLFLGSSVLYDLKRPAAEVSKHLSASIINYQ